MKNRSKALILILVFLFAEVSLQADDVVSDFSDTGLRNAVATGGTITFGGDGTIILNSQILITKNTIIDATGRNVTISGNALTRLFEVGDDVNVTFRGLNLINGMHHPPQAGEGGGLPAFGGAILFHSGELALYSCVLSNNVAWGGMGSSLPGSGHGSASGGAIYADSGFIRLADSIFIHNRATGFDQAELSLSAATGGSAYGGALAIETGNLLSIERCHFIENRARGGVGVRPGAGGVGYGGALHIPSSGANIVDSVFQANNAHGGESYHGASGMGQGGAVWSGSGGIIYLLGSTVSSNSATAASALAAGGGIYNRASMDVLHSSIVRNFAKGGKGRVIQNSSGAGYDAVGGGVYNAGLAGFTNVTFLQNAAYAGDAADPALSTQGAAGSAFGGGIYNVSSVLFAYVTMALNQVVPAQPTLGALGVLKGSDLHASVGGITYARSSIFASIPYKSISGVLGDGGFNIVIDDSASFTQPSSFNSSDPLLGPARATYIPLASGSPAIDSASSDWPAWDQLRLPRPGGTRADRGAIEYREIRMGQISLEAGNARVRVTNNSGVDFKLQKSTDAQNWTDAGFAGGAAANYEFLIPRSSQGGVTEFYRAVAPDLNPL